VGGILAICPGGDNSFVSASAAAVVLLPLVCYIGVRLKKVI
jgi:hypothetical protein